MSEEVSVVTQITHNYYRKFVKSLPNHPSLDIPRDRLLPFYLPFYLPFHSSYVRQAYCARFVENDIE
jgi:hypothetical protein